MAQPKSRDEFITIYVDEVRVAAPELTDFEEGSLNDALSGACATACEEATALIIDEFRKTFFSTATGTEDQGGEGTVDDLQFLAVDHFGDDFERPDSSLAVGIVTFSRPNSGNGDTNIPAGTIVKTDANANGEAQRFETILDINMDIGGPDELAVDASVVALVAGPTGNVDPGDIKNIEDTLTDDTIVVTNALATTGGNPEEDDPTFRATILRKIQELRGATKGAIEAAAVNVAGVEKATPTEFAQTVIEFDEATQMTIGAAFRIPRTKLFIADASGGASAALIANVVEATRFIRACGVRVDVFGATALLLDWTAALTLNPSGPNFADLSADPEPILATMRTFLEDLDIGEDFIRAEGNAAILAIWGPTSIGGSDDLIANGFVTVLPSGDVATAEDDKLLPGTMGTA